MAFAVCGTAQLMCSFGIAPSVFNVLPASCVMTTTPIANIMDNVPFVNILPFGMCTSPSNPVFASTGVPGPCIPAPAAPWAPPCPTVMIGGKPAVSNTSKLMCSLGGVIQVMNPGTTNIMLP